MPILCFDRNLFDTLSMLYINSIGELLHVLILIYKFITFSVEKYRIQNKNKNRNYRFVKTTMGNGSKPILLKYLELRLLLDYRVLIVPRGNLYSPYSLRRKKAYIQLYSYWNVKPSIGFVTDLVSWIKFNVLNDELINVIEQHVYVYYKCCVSVVNFIQHKCYTKVTY